MTIYSTSGRLSTPNLFIFSHLTGSIYMLICGSVKFNTIKNMITEQRSCNCEDKPCCSCDNGSFEVEENEVHGWAGDGSGEDDLADYNANEADDYQNEGGEDSYLDASWEDRFENEYDGD